MSAVLGHYWAKSFDLCWQSDIEMEHFESADVGDESADVVVYEAPHLKERNPTERINRGLARGRATAGWPTSSTPPRRS